MTSPLEIAEGVAAPAAVRAPGQRDPGADQLTELLHGHAAHAVGAFPAFLLCRREGPLLSDAFEVCPRYPAQVHGRIQVDAGLGQPVGGGLIVPVGAVGVGKETVQDGIHAGVQGKIYGLGAAAVR